MLCHDCPYLASGILELEMHIKVDVKQAAIHNATKCSVVLSAFDRSMMVVQGCLDALPVHASGQEERAVLCTKFSFKPW